MTDNQKEFCTKVAELCEAADSIELFRPIIKVWALYEDAQGNGTDQTNTKILNVDLNNVSEEELNTVQAELQQSIDAKKALNDAKQTQDEVNSALANKLNADAAENASQDEVNEGSV